MLNLVSKRKPDGYWENIDLLRDALLQLVHAFWFKEVDEDTGAAFYYNDISGALAFDEPEESSGGGLDVPVMPSMADVLEARRWDVHQAILLHGGYKEVAAALGWMQKRTSENRHLLQFATLAREMEGFLEESGKEFGIPEGRMPSEEILLSADRDDLVQGVKWHGGFVRVSRRLGKLNYAASELTHIDAAARAFRDFVLEKRQEEEDEREEREGRRRDDRATSTTTVASSSEASAALTLRQRRRLREQPPPKVKSSWRCP